MSPQKGKIEKKSAILNSKKLKKMKKIENQILIGNEAEMEAWGGLDGTE